MFKQILTLVRGTSHETTQAFLDNNAVVLLRQQIRDAAHGVARARKSVAIVMAHAEREKRSLAALNEKIEDLETRAREALSKDREDLTRQAAQAIADLEDERTAPQTTIETYDREFVVLRETVKKSATLLAELKRGQRLAEATEATQKTRGSYSDISQSDLTDAAATLRRLQERQSHADATMTALAELSCPDTADAVSDRLAEAGMGSQKRPTAETVMERLKASHA